MANDAEGKENREGVKPDRMRPNKKEGKTGVWPPFLEKNGIVLTSGLSEIGK